MYRSWIAVLLLVILSWISACTSRKEIASTDATRQPSSSTTSSGQEKAASKSWDQAILETRRKAINEAIEEARRFFEEGRSFWIAGERETARDFFNRSLECLRVADLELAENMNVQAVYDELSSEMQRLEILASIRQDEPPFPILDSLEPSESPLDEIGAVDLYEVEIDPGLEDLVSEDLHNTRFDIPVVVTKEVLKFLDYYQGRGRKAMEASLIRSGKYLPLFREIFKKEGLPLDLIYMAHVESLFKPQAYSRARARGIWQFVKGTAQLYDLKVGWWLDERLDIYKSTQSAARYLKDLYEQFGCWYLALAGYNGGPGRVSRVIRKYGEMDYWTMAKRRLLLRETRNYVPSILAAIIISRNPQRYGFVVEPAAPLEFEKVPLEYQVDLAVIAESIDVPLRVITELNPELQRGVTPFETSGYRLKVPPGSKDYLTQKLAEIPPEKRLRLKHHRVQQGETLSHISARYGISIRAIAEVNRIRNIHRLKLGQDLIIPLSNWKASGNAEVRQASLQSGKHTVRRGESLYRISRIYGVALNDLFKWNDIEPGELIHPGQKIRISAASASASRPASAGGENK